MTFLKFGITSNHLANSFPSDLSYTFDAHSKVEHRGFHASDSYDSLDLSHSKHCPQQCPSL